MKAVGCWLVWIDASKQACELCEGGVGLMIDHIVVNGSGVDDLLDDRLSPVWPCFDAGFPSSGLALVIEFSRFGLALLVAVDDECWHCVLLVLRMMMLILVLMMAITSCPGKDGWLSMKAL